MWIAVLVALALLSAALVRAMIAARVLDVPGHRSSHTRPTPKGGGVGIVAAWAAGLVLWLAWRGEAPFLPWLLAGGVLLAVVALLDDLRGFPFAVKFAAQLLAALLAVAGGLRLHALVLWGAPVPLGVAGPVLSVGWVLFATNATNFMDGLNGLAAGVCALAAAAMAVAALAAGEPGVAFAAAALCAGLAGFLPFNYPRARIFMGDVGSQVCGFALAALAMAPGAGGTPLFPLAPLLLYGLLFDVAFTLVRRARAGARLTEAHRSHLYQVAHRAGLRAPLDTVIAWLFVVWGAGAALAGWSGSVAAAVLAGLPPQLAWLGWVAWRARRAGLSPW